MVDRRIEDLETRVAVLELRIVELVAQIEDMQNVYDVGGVVLEGAPQYVKKFAPSGDNK
jgi:uncharacterized coiled-coil protein SlyX